MELRSETVSSCEWMSVKEASRWASQYLQREIEESNILYLVQYGRVRKNTQHGLQVHRHDLENYYADRRNSRESQWKEKLGYDLNWALSFEHLREKDTTKHVHRLHPYKGKFIPQLVEYFLDDRTDAFKTQVYFQPGDIVLDPFCGSGTTLVQSAEMGLHAIGVDVSRFNAMISRVKLVRVNPVELLQQIKRIQHALARFEHEHHLREFERELNIALTRFNNTHFPSPDFKYRVAQRQIDERSYALKKESEFLAIYQRFVEKYNVTLHQSNADGFLGKWYMANIRAEIDCAFEQIKTVDDPSIKQVIAVILSRTIRSCRATTHSDLATLKEPQLTTYYCWKHKKICKPLFSIKDWFNRYAKDTVARLEQFAMLRKNTHHVIISADSRNVDIPAEVARQKPAFYDLIQRQKIKGIFTSPPYVGQIDYHEQHAYAYELFGFERKDESEIGPLFKGQNAVAKQSYVEGIAAVLRNCQRFLADDFDIFMVANDKHNLYPAIAQQSGLQIVNQFKRPVLNRTERDKSPYAEIIFHLKAGV